MGQDSEEIEKEEEYVLLDLDSVSADIDIPQDAPYVLSGLDTLNPILIIDNKIKLIGEYEETIGTCIIFDESEVAPIAHEQTGPSETNLLSSRRIMDPKQTPAKQVNPLASLHKVLKFKLFLDADDENGEDVAPIAHEQLTDLQNPLTIRAIC
ncbi:uncharacterized protein [Primulina huaijiensis]|uniref:uncharacterized protein n=1 Tax=Primulina huaijiensis TaxID=1492673 RepID=UPI003CC71230